jgi:hypothetical protein
MRDFVARDACAEVDVEYERIQRRSGCNPLISREVAARALHVPPDGAERSQYAMACGDVARYGENMFHFPFRALEEASENGRAAAPSRALREGDMQAPEPVSGDVYEQLFLSLWEEKRDRPIDSGKI